MNQRQDQILKELRNICKERDELFAALPGAIRIGQLWTEAFENGQTCTPHLVGTSWPRPQHKPKYPKPYEQVREISRTFLQREDGVVHELSTEDFFSIITAGS